MGLCIYLAFPFVLATTIQLYSNCNVSGAQAHGIDEVLTHAYPKSTMIRADAVTGSWSAGDGATVSVLVTFESGDSLDTIKSWYINHPAGGQIGCDGGENFPAKGLEKLDDAPAGKTSYRATYSQTVECATDCDRPLQQIR